MFIDIHVHYRDVPCLPRHGQPPYCTSQQLIERYDAVGIEKGVVLPGGANPECCYASQSTQEVVATAEKTGRFIPFCNVDPRALTNSPYAPLGDLLRFYKDMGCKGIGETCCNLSFLDPLVQNLFHHVEEVGLPLTFHISPTIGNNYGLYDEFGLPGLELCLQRFPNLKFFGHSQAFWAEITELRSPWDDRFTYPDYPVETEGRVPYLMRKYPNLYGDLSAGSGCNAVKRDRRYGIAFLTEFQDRLFFGTDICAPSTPTPLVDYLLDLRQSGDIAESVFQKIARENAIRVLGLE